MRVKKLLDDIEQSPAYLNMPSEIRPDRRMLLRWMSNELTLLTGKISNASIFAIHLEPAIVCVVGIRDYSLPRDFGFNFVRKSAQQYVCMIDDGSSEAVLEYLDPASFYTLNLTAESNGKPSRYTIIVSPVGRRRLVLSPPPDDDYEIDGIYVPDDWDLDDEDSLPPIPGNSAVLLNAVLRRINPQMYEAEYQNSVAQLTVEMARLAGSTVISPRLTAGRDY